MDWNCTESDKRLSDYLERLTSPEETEAFSAHIKQCANCATLVARVGATVQLLRATEPVDVPPQLFAKIISATSGASPSARGWRRWIRPPAIAWQPQFAMGAITVAASFLIIFHAASASRNAQNFATLNPLNLYRAADRQVHVTYAHTAKFVSDMRLVYEIESRLEPDQEQESSPAAPPAQGPGSSSQPESQPKSEATPHPSAIRTHARSVYASETPGDYNFSATRSHS
jgi:predicted anti-sigma-YlaC factor YlaD